ncbi:MAG: hypothetical protein WB523_20785 [Candidatus Sulfotelmatobacter sp.]
MKRNLIGILSLVVMSVILNTTAHSQSSVKADVPFAFKVGAAELPAGTYAVNTLGSSIIEIRNPQTSAGALSIAMPEYQGDSATKLVFHHLGDQYFLSEIWRGAGTNGMVIAPSEKEKSLKKELQLAKAPASDREKVVIALK